MQVDKMSPRVQRNEPWVDEQPASAVGELENVDWETESESDSETD
jgi:hypothetical protein